MDHLINQTTPSSKRATMISLFVFAGNMDVFIFAPLVGHWSDLYTINTAFMLSAIILFIVPFMYLFLKIQDKSQ